MLIWSILPYCTRRLSTNDLQVWQVSANILIWRRQLLSNAYYQLVVLYQQHHSLGMHRQWYTYLHTWNLRLAAHHLYLPSPLIYKQGDWPLDFVMVQWYLVWAVTATVRVVQVSEVPVVCLFITEAQKNEMSCNVKFLFIKVLVYVVVLVYLGVCRVAFNEHSVPGSLCTLSVRLCILWQWKMSHSVSSQAYAWDICGGWLMDPLFGMSSLCLQGLLSLAPETETFLCVFTCAVYCNTLQLWYYCILCCYVFLQMLTWCRCLCTGHEWRNEHVPDRVGQCHGVHAAVRVRDNPTDPCCLQAPLCHAEECWWQQQGSSWEWHTIRMGDVSSQCRGYDSFISCWRLYTNCMCICLHSLEYARTHTHIHTSCAVQCLTQSVSSFHSTWPHQVNVPFVITKLTGFASVNCPTSLSSVSALWEWWLQHEELASTTIAVALKNLLSSNQDILNDLTVTF